MGDNVIFEDYTIECIGAIDTGINGALHEVAGEVVSQTQRNSREKTSRTKNSFRYKIKTSGDTHTAYIGSNYQNAIWEEFGTGEWALNGDGRKGGWVYAADSPGFFGRLVGKKPSKFIYTIGKKPTRAFWNAYNSLKGAIINHLQDALRGL